MNLTFFTSVSLTTWRLNATMRVKMQWLLLPPWPCAIKFSAWLVWLPKEWWWGGPQDYVRISRGRRRLISLDPEQSQKSRQGGCDSQALALSSLSWLSFPSDWGTCVWQKQSAPPQHGPGRGALGCWCATFLPNRPSVFSAPQPGPSSGSFGQDGACPMEARTRHRGSLTDLSFLVPTGSLERSHRPGTSWWV